MKIKKRRKQLAMIVPISRPRTPNRVTWCENHLVTGPGSGIGTGTTICFVLVLSMPCWSLPSPLIGMNVAVALESNEKVSFVTIETVRVDVWVNVGINEEWTRLNWLKYGLGWTSSTSPSRINVWLRLSNIDCRLKEKPERWTSHAIYAFIEMVTYRQRCHSIVMCL